MFSAAVDGGAWPLALIGVLASSAAAFFYVRIIVLMFFTNPAGSDDDAALAVAGATDVSALAYYGSDPVGDNAVASAVETLLQAEPDARSTITTTVVKTEGLAIGAIVICAILTILLGIAPSPVIEAIQSVATFLP